MVKFYMKGQSMKQISHDLNIPENTVKSRLDVGILAYGKPVTVPELAMAIGISTTYIEPIVEKLIKGELMKQVADKVYTDFIIYTQEDRLKNYEAEKALAEKLYKEIWHIVEQGLVELHGKEYCIRIDPMVENGMLWEINVRRRIWSSPTM